MNEHQIPYLDDLLKKRLMKDGINLMIDDCHGASRKSGWYTDPKTGEPIERNIPEMMMLMVSEISEGMEAFRKNLMDDKLPHRKGLEVELVDLLIRTFDLAGYVKGLPDYEGIDIAESYIEKRMFNDEREDHKLKNRAKEGGKKF